MTNPRDPDSRLEELLRSTLHGEAESISPAGDGLARIQQRTAARRRLWLRPVAVVGGAAVVAAAGFTAYAVTAAHHDGNDTLLSKQPTVVPSTPQTSTSPTPTPSNTPPAAPAFPAQAFYPFTSAAQEQSWEAQQGYVAQPWVIDPVAEAKNFVTQFAGITDLTRVVSSQKSHGSATVTLGRPQRDASSTRVVAVTTVHLARYGKAWLVAGASDPSGFLKVSSPTAGGPVSSPLTVRGPAFGVEESVHLDVMTIGKLILGSSSLTNGDSRVMFGNGTPTWSAALSFTPPSDPRGAVVLTELSLADSGTSRLVVTPVAFATTATTGYPAYFYGVKDGRVTKFSSRTGAAISYLTAPAPGGGASDPQRLRDKVFYLSGSGTCANELRSVSINGGNSASVRPADPGYVITGYALGYNIAIYETACDAATSPAAKLAFDMPANDPPGPASNTATFDGVPPGIVGDPTWSDGRHVAAILRTGTANTLHDYDSWTAKKALDGTTPCHGSTSNAEPDAIAADSAGNLWYAERTGSSMHVVRCIGSMARVMFTVAGNHQPADLAIAGSGGAALLTDTDGHVWRWNDGGNVTQLTPSVPLTQLSW